MSKIFVTSDHHFGHRNIIKYCSRPYGDVYEMDKDLIEQWNQVVTNKDVVIYGGDFTIKNDKKYAEKILAQLNYKFIILIRGNHDYSAVVSSDKWSMIADSITLRISNNKRKVFIQHHPYNNIPTDGNIRLHGHSHGTLTTKFLTFDFGIDSVANIIGNYQPILLEEAIKFAEEYNNEL